MLPTRFDSYRSLVTGLGDDVRDKMRRRTFETSRLSLEDWRELWRGHALAARIVERPAEDMLREGWCVVTGDPGLDAAVRGFVEDLRLDENLQRAMEFQRALGGGAVVLGIDDGQDLETPVREDLIRSFQFVRVLDASELWAAPETRYTWEWITTGRPPIYEGRLPDGARLRIHRSRLLAFEGVITGETHRWETRGWGDGALQRVDDTLASYSLTWSAADVVFSEWSLPVYQIKGWTDLLAADADGKAAEIIRAIDYAKSVVHGVVFDVEDKVERLSAGFAGVGDYLDRLTVRLSADADMPATFLFGRSPAGMNATGDSDVRNYYDRVRAKQIRFLKPKLERVVRTVLRLVAPTFSGDWKIEFGSLWQLSDKERAEVDKLTAETDKIYLDSRVRTPEQIAEVRFGERPKQSETATVAPVAGQDLQSTALNGAQVQSALQIVQQVAGRLLPREAGIGMLESFFQLSPADAERVMGEVGRTFFAAVPDA